MSASVRRSAPEDLVAALECVKQQAAELVAENQQLQKALADSEHEDPAASAICDEAWPEERQSHQDAMQQMEQENQELADRLVIADKENSQLVNLYVASSQLHSSL